VYKANFRYFKRFFGTISAVLGTKGSDMICTHTGQYWARTEGYSTCTKVQIGILPV
jgi:hypothetical protein